MGNVLWGSQITYSIAGNRTWQYCLPQSKIIMYSFIWRTAVVLKIKEISSSVPGLSVMIPHECYVDRLFPGHVIRQCVRTSPPPCSPGSSCLFNPLLLGLTLKYLYAVTWTYDWYAWFSPIYIFMNISNNTFCNCKFWSLE